MNLKGKKVLLWAPSFYALHIQIIEGLKKSGCEVSFIADCLQSYNPNFSTSSFKFLKKIYYSIVNPNVKYIKQYEAELDQKYDLLFVINGYAFDEYLINFLKRKNPNLKSVLYLWDGLAFFDFSNNFQYFDSVFTFDIKDAKDYGVNFLPLFWVKEPFEPTLNLSYDLFFVGTLHSDRCRILDKISKQCEREQIKSFLRLVIRKRILNVIDKLRYLYYKYKKTPNAQGFIDEYLYLKNRKKSSFLTTDILSSQEFYQKMINSKCVLDLELPYQTGVTNRMIAALANHKKIVTTNVYVKEYPFYDQQNINIISREDPYVEKSFVSSEFVKIAKIEEYMEGLYINKWLEQILK